MTEEELILTSLLDCRRVDLYTQKKTLTAEQEDQLAQIKLRRQLGEPLQYILGSCEFFGLRFLVDQRVLIPRPETELLVEAVLLEAKNFKKPFRILDIGTGTGNIAVSLAKHLDDCSVVACDVSKEALDVAKKNAQINGVAGKIDFVRSDLFASLREDFHRKRLFDIIVSNPPYIALSEIQRLPREVICEPRIALNGGKEGLDFYGNIAEEAPDFLKEKGMLFLEIGDGQRQAVCDIFTRTQKFTVKNCINDYTQTPRVLIMELKTHG